MDIFKINQKSLKISLTGITSKSPLKSGWDGSQNNVSQNTFKKHFWRWPEYFF